MKRSIHVVQIALLGVLALALSHGSAHAQFWGNPYMRMAQMQNWQQQMYMQSLSSQMAGQVYGTNYGIPIYANSVANYYGGYNPYLYNGGWGYGNPYVPPVAAAGAADPYLNQYTPGGNGAGNPYTPGGVNPYNPYSPYGGYGYGLGAAGPGVGSGAYLMGASDVMRSYGNVIQAQESARLLREQVNQAKLETRKKAFELEMYIKANTPTYTQEQEKVAKNTLRRIQTNSLPGEVANGKSLNYLLDDLRKYGNKKISLEPMTLSEGVLSRLNVTQKTFGLGILRDDGRVTWPAALQERMSVKQRKELDEQLKELVKGAYRDKLDVNLLKDVSSEVGKMRDDLMKRVNDIPTNQYLDAKRFLQEFDDATKALENGEAPIQAKFQREIEGGRSVQELVEYMVKNALRFGPATARDEPAYRAVHSALATYDIAMNAALGDGKD